MKDYAGTILRGIITIIFLSVSSVFALIGSTWGESDRMARLFEIQLDKRLGGSLYWPLRLFAFFLELLILMVLFHIFFVTIVRWL